MGKAARQRRLKKEKERQRRRTAHAPADGHGAPWPGPSGPRTQAPPPPGHGEPSLRELTALAIGEALRALAEGSTDIFRTCVATLGSQRRPGLDAMVSRELVGCLRAAVTAAWRHGWQPAELVRHVGREIGDAHARMAADMIAGEMRAYAAATVDDRWRAQLGALGRGQRAGLGGGGGWGSDAASRDGWRAGGGGSWEMAVSTGLGLLYVLHLLAVLPRLCPLPGRARRGAARQPAGPERAADERMLSKIRALLAKAESTEFAEEAEARSARAQELTAKYSIDHALLASEAGREDEPTGPRLPVDNPHESANASLLSAVAKANRCRSVRYEGLGMSAVIGFAAD